MSRALNSSLPDFTPTSKAEGGVRGHPSSLLRSSVRSPGGPDVFFYCLPGSSPPGNTLANNLPLPQPVIFSPASTAPQPLKSAPWWRSALSPIRSHLRGSRPPKAAPPLRSPGALHLLEFYARHSLYLAYPCWSASAKL